MNADALAFVALINNRSTDALEIFETSELLVIS
jgi:hypothetical protein